MPVLFFLLLFSCMVFGVGALTTLAITTVTHRKQVTCSEVLKNSVFGSGVVMLCLHILVFLLPLHLILHPVIYTLFVFSSLIAVWYLKPKLDHLFLWTMLLYFVLSIYVFQTEIFRDSIISFGGNGDFFILEKMSRYLFQYKVHSNAELVPIYGLAQEFVDWGRYPIGSHLLLAFFGLPFKYLFPEAFLTSFHKVFLSYSLISGLLLIRTKLKNFLLPLLVCLSIFSLPLLHSVVGMDFMPQLACFVFVIPLVKAVIERDNSKVLFWTLCVGLVYYPMLFALVPLYLIELFFLTKEKKIMFIFLLCSLALLLGFYFAKNIKMIAGESHPLGGLEQDFSLVELSSLKPIKYGPAFNDPYDFLFHFIPPFLGVLARVVFYGIVSVQVFDYFRDRHQDRKRRQLQVSILALQLVFLVVAEIFFQPYVVYKFFSAAYLILLVILIDVFSTETYTTNKQTLRPAIIGSIAFILLNLEQSVPYHNNWLRSHYQQVPYTENFKFVLNNFKDGTVLIHRDIAFPSLLSIYSMDKKLYSFGFYFHTFEDAMLPGYDIHNFCDLSAYDKQKVKVILLDQEACEDGIPKTNYAVHNQFNDQVIKIDL